MTDTIEVYDIGSKVELLHTIRDRLVAVVIAIGIFPTGIQYKLTWLDGRQRRVEWVESIEIGPLPGSKVQRIGFYQEENSK